MDAEYWFPFYPEVFRINTRHLTLEQDCLYRRLIDEYMTTREPLPDNDNALARICGVAPACFGDAAGIVRAFFRPENGLLHHDFCNKILNDQDIRANKRSVHASKAAQKRWSKTPENIQDNAPSMPPACPDNATQTQTVDITNVISKPKRKKVENGKRLKDWYTAEGHTGLPEAWRLYANNTHGWDAKRIEDVGRAFWRYWNGPDARKPLKRSWDQTWANWVDRDQRDRPQATSRGRQGYSLDAVHDQALADVYRSEGREERLKRFGIGADTPDD